MLLATITLAGSGSGAGRRGRRGADVAGHRVGAYDASFVPTASDFARLDPRFRLPDAVRGRVPAYADYGFAVFKLRKGEAEVHPLARRAGTEARDPSPAW